MVTWTTYSSKIYATITIFVILDSNYMLYLDECYSNSRISAVGRIRALWMPLLMITSGRSTIVIVFQCVSFMQACGFSRFTVRNSTSWKHGNGQITSCLVRRPLLLVHTNGQKNTCTAKRGYLASTYGYGRLEDLSMRVFQIILYDILAMTLYNDSIKVHVISFNYHESPIFLSL